MTNLKCTGANVAEIGVGAAKAPQWTVTLEPTDGGPSIRINGGAGSVAASLVYGKTYALTEVA